MKLSGELVNTAHEKIDCQQAVDFFIGSMLLIWAGDVDHLLDHSMQKLRAVVVGGVVIHFFSFAAAGDELRAFELLEMVAHSRAGHAHHGREIDHTFFAMAEQPENTDAVAIGQLFEDLSDRLKIAGLGHLLEGAAGKLSVIVGQVDVGHEAFLLMKPFYHISALG